MLLCLLALAVVACGRPRLAGTEPSAEALAREVMAAVQRRDEARLRALALTAHEFEHAVWPSLPAARPERNLPWSYVWGDLRQKSDLHLRRLLDESGGRRYELDEVRFPEGTSEYAGFRVHRAAVLTVRDGAGARQELRLFGSAIETDEGWKVFSYVIDD
jgi:hypothetical protein